MKQGILSILLCLFACLAQAKTYILCVGISDYPGTVNDLRVSAQDALTINNIFSHTKQAASLYLTNQAATITKVKSTMQQLFAQATQEDVIILYFSGHGTPGSVVCYDGFLPYKDIISIMAACLAKNKVIMVDACYAGKMRDSNKRDTNYSAQNVMLFLSSRTNEKSLESQYKNSWFTIYLERGLRGGADTNHDKIITAQELYNFVHPGVIKATRSRQHPVMWGKFSNDMPIIKW